MGLMLIFAPRELAAFIWAINREVMAHATAS
jgi:hypothetical protein